MAFLIKVFKIIEMRGLLFLIFIALTPKAALAANWGFNGGAHFGLGPMGHDTLDAYENRTVGTMDLQALPGIKPFGEMILTGLLLDFRLLTQLTKMDKNTRGDFGGSGFLAGPAVLLDFTLGRLLLSYDLRARTRINQPDNTTFKGSGFHMIFSYAWVNKVAGEFQLVKTTYKTFVNSLGEFEFPAEPLTQISYCFGASIVF